MLTLRQIEVVRAVMLSGSIAGAARLLNVAQPGVSRTMKHIEATIGIRLFARRGGRHVPAVEARDVFEQLQAVNEKIENLNAAIRQLHAGADVELRIGSVPSIANVMVPRAIEKLRRRFPGLRVTIDVLKIEEAIDHLLLGRGEVVLMSQRYTNASIVFDDLARGRLVCIVAPTHPLAGKTVIAARDLAPYPLIGIDPRDPYGRIMTDLFERDGLAYTITIRARFGTTVCALVKQNLGVALIDAFTVADSPASDLVVIPLAEPTDFPTFVAHRADTSLSSFATAFVGFVRQAMEEAMEQGGSGRARR